MKSHTATDRKAMTGSLPDTCTSGAGTGENRRTKSAAALHRKQVCGGTPGRHVIPVVLEAMRILKEEGYFVGRLSDPDIPFDLIGFLNPGVMFVKVVRAKQPVENAKGVARYFSGTIRKIQPFWQQDSDNFQFWVFSKVAGLLRYRVYRGGIWNESLRKGSDPQFTVKEMTGPAMRTTAPAAA
jgi:hypothetical protein